MKSLVTGLTAVLLAAVVGVAVADNVPQTLPFSQNWTNTGMITLNDDWSGVPGVVGYLGDISPASVTGVNPTTLVGDSVGAVDVIANQTVTTISNGGVAEFHIADPVVALQGSGAADAPNIRIHINTTGYQNITFACNLRDLDGSTDNAIQQVAVQFRVGGSGSWTNISGGYIADATTGPSLATLVTPVSVVLPATANNVSEIQIRVLTTNAAGNDEWVGIDDISVTGTLLPVPVENTTWSAIKAQQ